MSEINIKRVNLLCDVLEKVHADHQPFALDSRECGPGAWLGRDPRANKQGLWWGSFGKGDPPDVHFKIFANGYNGLEALCRFFGTRALWDLLTKSPQHVTALGLAAAIRAAVADETDGWR